MFKNFDWQHWVLTLLGIATGVAGVIMQFYPTAPLWLRLVGPIAGVILVQLGLAKQSYVASQGGTDKSGPSTLPTGMSILMFAFCLIALACSPAQRMQIEKDIGKDVACVGNSVMGNGVEDPQRLLSDCGVTSAGSLVDILNTLLTSQPPAPDGGELRASESKAHVSRALANAKALAGSK